MGFRIASFGLDLGDGDGREIGDSGLGGGTEGAGQQEEKEAPEENCFQGS